MTNSLFSFILWVFWILPSFSRPLSPFLETSGALLKRSSADSNGSINPFVTNLVIDGTTFPVMIDTDSLDTWVIGFETSNNTDYQRNGSFSSNGISGTKYKGSCQLNDLSSTVSFGSVSSSEVSIDYGSLGLGRGSSDSNGNPTFLNSLYTNRIISSEACTLFVEEQSSTIQFGDMDSSISSSASYFNTNASNSNSWAINVEQVSVGDFIVDLNSMLAIFETASPYIMLPSASAQSLFSQLGYAYMDYNTQIWYVPCSTSSSLTFSFNGVNYDIPASQWIDTTQPSNRYCPSLVRPASISAAVLGSPFFKSVHVHFDVSKQQVALAPAPSEDITTSSASKEVILTTYYFYSTTTLPCTTTTTDMSLSESFTSTLFETQPTTAVSLSSSDLLTATSSDTSFSTNVTSAPSTSPSSSSSDSSVSGVTSTLFSSCFQTSTIYSVISSEGSDGQIYTSSLKLTSLIPCETTASSIVTSTTISSSFPASSSSSITSLNTSSVGVDYEYSTFTVSCSECHIGETSGVGSSILSTHEPSGSSPISTTELSSSITAETTASQSSNISSPSFQTFSSVDTSKSEVSSYTSHYGLSFITTEIYYETVTLPCEDSTNSFTTVTRPVTSIFPVSETTSRLTEFTSSTVLSSSSEGSSSTTSSLREWSAPSSTVTSAISSISSTSITASETLSTSSITSTMSTSTSSESFELPSSVTSETAEYENSSYDFSSTGYTEVSSVSPSPSLPASEQTFPSSSLSSAASTSYTISSSLNSERTPVSESSFGLSTHSDTITSPTLSFSSSIKQTTTTEETEYSSGTTTALASLSESSESTVSSSLRSPSNSAAQSSLLTTATELSSTWSSLITTEVTHFSTFSCDECEGQVTTVVWTEFTTLPCPSSSTSLVAPSVTTTSEALSSLSLSTSSTSDSTSDITRVPSLLSTPSSPTSSNRLPVETSISVGSSSSYQSDSQTSLESYTSEMGFSSSSSISVSSTSLPAVSTVTAECRGAYCITTTAKSTNVEVSSGATTFTSSANHESIQCTGSFCETSTTSMVTTNFPFSTFNSNSTASTSATMIFTGQGNRIPISGFILFLASVLCLLLL